MALSARLQQKQSQSLVMTPQLAQSIKLLQYSYAELAEFIQGEIEKNPLIELDPETSMFGKERRADRGSENTPQNDQEKSQDNSGNTTELVSDGIKLDAGSNEASLDTSFENVYDEGTAGAEQISSSGPSGSASTSSNGNTEGLDFIATVGEKPSLAQYLESQISLTFKHEKRREIAAYIAHGLSEDGYFHEDLNDVAKRYSTNLAEIEAVLTKFQTLEPVGIGARNLAECLTLQLKEKNRFDPAIKILIENLDLLAKREFSQLMKLCDVNRDDFNEMIADIKRLDPRPASQYEPVLSQTVIPDVLISQKTDGGWLIDLNPETLPRVLVNREYHAELSTVVDTAQGKEFIAECLGNANWLTKSLDQRAQTILKVATEIVKQQDMFFAEGVEHLRPLNLKTVADSIKMHESTVSRVTSNKFLMCNQGIFELKYFFSSSINSTTDEEGHAAETVRHKIKQLVDAENPKKILSDEQIVNHLQEIGIEIARRTVAKYREAMRIPSSVQRRRNKKQA